MGEKNVLQIGSYNTLVVQRRVDFGLYLNPKEEEVLLPSKYVPPNVRVGDALRVFVYTDSEDRPVATTLTPKAVVGEVAYLMVKDTAAIGSFMDWGLEKDLLVPRAACVRASAAWSRSCWTGRPTGFSAAPGSPVIAARPKAGSKQGSRSA